MAAVPEIKKLNAESRSLKVKNARLKRRLSVRAALQNATRSTAAASLLIIAVLLLTIANLVFWVGNTVVKNDRFMEATASIIDQPPVQKAIAQYTTTEIFNNVDVTSYITAALPPRADFLAPTLTTQLQQQTQNQLQDIVGSQPFRTAWQQIMSRQHDRLIERAANYQGDGTIELNDVYQQLSQRLQGTQLAFLANRPLPAKTGSITVVDAAWLPKFHNLVVHIDTWRFVSALVIVACFTGAVALSRRRRRLLYLGTGLIFVAMAATLIGVAIGRHAAVSAVDTDYASAAGASYDIFIRPLQLQTVMLAIAALLMAAIAWLNSPALSSIAFRRHVRRYTTATHIRLFRNSHAPLYDWTAAHKQHLEWLLLAVATISLFAGRLTHARLLWCLGVLTVGALAIEVIARPQHR